MKRTVGLPQALPALIPRGIVKYGVATAHCCSSAPEGLPSNSNARFESSLIHFDTDPPVRIHPWNQKLSGSKVKIGLSIVGFRHRCHKCPSESEVES